MRNIFKLLPVLILITIAFVMTGCGAKGDKTNVEIIQDFMESPAIKAQESDEFFEDHAGGARVPPENTRPVGYKPYKYGTNAELAAKENKNPLAGDTDPQMLMVGQKFYATNCTACHGIRGNGDGTVAARWPGAKIPSLQSNKIRGWNDAQIYHAITMGQGVMGPYASHIPQAYRWQVVNWIRHLQKNNPVKETN